ncbi:MAG TPA: hypothetical protein PK200_16700, partial [Spirochaetota bacterium]|nr:hypothetical protein [Spirochaetota bacterium]
TLEKNSLHYRERNSVVWDSLFDSSSLRYESEQGRADRVTEQIISDTNEELQRVESDILRRDTSTREGAGAVDISNLGDNWQDRIKELLEQGNEKWRLAQEELYREMRLWKTTAEEAYDKGEKEWQDAYNRLEAAHKKWQEDIQEEINEGINAWTAQQQELSQNLLDSQQYSNQYLNLQMEQWNNHSAELYRILTEGQQAVAEAKENLAWFQEMYDLYENTGFFNEGISGIYLYEGEDVWASDVMLKILGYAAGNPLAYELMQILYWQTGFYGLNPLFYYYGTDELYYLLSNKYTNYRRIYIENFEIIPSIIPEYDENTGILIEHYNIKVRADNIGIDRRRDGLDLWTPYGIAETIVSYTNTIGPDTDISRKSRLYYYITEKSGWNSIVNNINSTITNSETYLHNELLLGENGGPGYLTNSDGTYGLKYLANGDLENDTYLMTQSEMQHEYARRDMEYRKERLGIAEAVLQYARPDMYDDTNPYVIGGIREDAGTTEQRVTTAKSEMERLKQEYDTAKSGIDVTLGTINTKKVALDALSGGVANAQKAMEEALPAYSAARLKVVEAENNGGADNALLEELQASGKAYHEAEAAYKELNEKIEAARKEYNDAVNSYTAHMNDVSEKYSAYHTAEQQYEMAYAVWEYANTPYLMESSEFETGIGTGQLVDGTGIDFNDLDAPDALERYQRCLEEYTATEQTLQAAKTAMDSQETAEDLAD